MKLAASLALGLCASQAAAETSLTDDAGGAQLLEASCDISIDLRGAVAQVEVRQRIANPAAAVAGTYAFDLPKGAVITGLSVRGNAGVETALPITGAFNSVDVSERLVLGADPALLVRLPQDATSQYMLRLQPIPQDHELVISTRYSAIADVQASALRLTLPGRSHRGKLTACRGTVRAAAGPGTTLAGIRVGKAVSAKATASFVLDDKDVAIEAMLSFAGREPVVWTQSTPLAGGWSASVVTVAAPALKTATWQPRRALFVIDGSRSMELVGKPLVNKVLGSVAAALPAGIELDAIIYDRTAERVFKTWRKESPAAIAELQAAVSKHTAKNGSSLETAFQVAQTAITDGTRAQTMVIVISDGVLGEVGSGKLVAALGVTASTADILSIAVSPAQTQVPDASVLRAPVTVLGGTFVEVAADDIDDALQVVDEWLRPSWFELDFGIIETADSLRSGGGFTRAIIHRTNEPALVLRGRGETTFKVTARPGPNAPGIAPLALSTLPPEPQYRRLFAGHPFVRDGLAFAVLTTEGKIARNRIAMVKGGGPYERITAASDPVDWQNGPAPVVTLGAPPKPNAIAKDTLERLFRDQLQPKAYACYQRALVASPRLSGTVLFELRMGRGEVTQVGITGTTDQKFEDCLRDAAFTLTVPFPDFKVNADDQTLAHYPLTFQVSEAKPVVVLGDADSSSPLDIDAIKGGVPNAKTPLGDLRPSKIP